MVVDDDGALEDRGVIQNKADEFRNGQFIEIDVAVLKDFRAAGDDVVRAVFAFGDGFHDVIRSQRARKDVDRLVGDLVIVEPFTDLTATCATWRNQNLNHADIVHVLKGIFKMDEFMDGW